MFGRIRYFRGHGIHSPFVYSLVRNVFMRRGMKTGENALYALLISSGIRKTVAAELQRLADYIGLQRCGIPGSYLGIEENAMNVVVPDIGGGGVSARADIAVGDIIENGSDGGPEGGIIVVVSPCGMKKFRRMAADNTDRLIIERRGYVAIFGRQYEPKQYFKL